MKGVYHTIEVVIAIMIVMSMFFVLFITPITNPEIERANIKSQIYNGLENLNSIGSLRENALANNATEIKNDLDAFIPFNIQLQVTVYNKSFSNLTEEFVDNPSDIVGVSYYIAGDFGNYSPREIRVRGWEFK